MEGVVRAMRRPFVMGVDGGPAARNVILLWGVGGDGPPLCLAGDRPLHGWPGTFAQRPHRDAGPGALPQCRGREAVLQDLYAALHAPGDILALEHYENCHPAFLRVLGDLAMRGSAPLSSRYLVNKQGILVDAGTALAPGAVGRIDPQGKYLVFFSHKGAAGVCGQAGRPGCRRPGDVPDLALYPPPTWRLWPPGS